MDLAGRYRLLGHLGSGGVADAHLARDEVLGEDVVLKVLRADREPEVLAREHAALLRCVHPNLVRARDFGWTDVGGARRPFYVAEFVAGPTLEQWVEGRRWPEVRGVLIDIARALAALHRSGLRHGDVKPDNVRVTDRGAVLLDLSCSAAIGAAAATVSGTFGYLAPELREGRAADGRADLYAFGVLWDRLPVRGPRAFERFRRSLCERDPAARPADVHAVLEALGAPVELVIAPASAAPLVGREPIVQAFDTFLARLLAREVGPRVFALEGESGHGHSRLCKELLWRAQRRAAATEAFLDRETIADVLGRALGRAIEQGLAPSVEALDALSGGARPHVLVVDDAHRLPTVDRARWDRLLEALPLDGSLAVVTTTTTTRAEVHRLAPLDAAAIARWASALSVPHVDPKELAALTGGRPVEIVGRLERALRSEDWRESERELPGDPVAQLRACLRRGDLEGARRIAAPSNADPRPWLAALEELASRGDVSDRIHLARAALRAGDPQRVERALAAIEPAALPTPLRIEHALATAELALKAARPDAALVALAVVPSDEARGADLRARAHLSQARYEEAESVARAAESEDPEIRARLLETCGLAAGYRGSVDSGRLLQQALEAHRVNGNHAGALRVVSYRAILAQRSGDVRAAIAGFREALAIAERHGLDDALATSWLNLATALTEEGDWGAALDAYAQALRYAALLRQTGTEASLRFNLANLYVEIGAVERAAPLWEQADASARSLGFDHLAAPLARLEGEIAALRRDDEAAEEAFARAADRYRASEAPVEAREVALLRAELAIDRGRLDEATDLLSAPSDVHRALDRFVRARLAFSRGLSTDAIRDCEDTLAHATDRRLAARAHGLLARCFAQRGVEDLATSHLHEARARWQRIQATLPPALHPAFVAHPHRADLQVVRAVASSSPLAARTALRRFLAVNRRLIGSLDAREVLEHAVDAAIELTGAERGFVLLRRAQELDVVAARNLDGEDVPRSHLKFSRSIAERVLASSEPVVTVDARADERFMTERSVHAMRLSSVACVPIRASEGARGALYLDNRFERGRFGDDDREVLEAFADQVAIALRNAELHEALAERTRALDEARAALQARVEGQAARIADLAREVETHKRALAYRYDYGRIVGRGPAMRRVLDTLERVIETDLPVLIRGESGTGKELVAKAIHFNGRRRERPMVSLNCAAVPEALIESELFGHKRGAFTGADRDAPGLFVEADGGTLFLDELGEMPLGMQAKLLRVLEDREVRPVGGSTGIQVDVRIVAATHRDLARAVDEGRFRQDLYYRIGVLGLDLPPLRDREEDLADLCLGFLAEFGGKRLTERAFAALREHRWPGNIRELRNVLARASALCDGDWIDAGDLGLAPRALPADRAEFEGDEAERLRRALREHRWNVCRVSRELGIPRQTLYRKMKKYGLHRTSGA